MEVFDYFFAPFKHHNFQNKIKAGYFRRIILMMLLCLITLNVEAQSPSYLQWFEGEIYLKNGVQYTGALKYDFRSDMVHLKKDTLNLTFHASNVLAFYIIKDPGIYLRFKSEPFAINRGKKYHRLFQIAYSGQDYEILSRENYLGIPDFTTFQASASENKFKSNFSYGMIIENRYYIQPRYGAITEVKLSRKKAIKAFPADNILKNFIISNRLHFKKFGDLIKIAEYREQIN